MVFHFIERFVGNSGQPEKLFSDHRYVQLVISFFFFPQTKHIYQGRRRIFRGRGEAIDLVIFSFNSWQNPWLSFSNYLLRNDNFLF